MITPLLLAGLAYLVGSIPTSYCLGKWVHGVDLRTQGSGNLGATNAYRILGAGTAAPVLLVDVLKGWIPVALFPRIAPDVAYTWTLVYAAAAVVGHMFSCWVGFRGGKGVATAAGAVLALAPAAAGVVAGIWLIAVVATGYVSVGSMLAAAALPFALVGTGTEAATPALPLFGVALTTIVLWSHRENVQRLIRGQEARFGRRGDRAP